MRLRLLIAPWWVLALLQGTFFGVSTTLLRWALFDSSKSFVGLVIVGVVSGVMFGLIMRPFTARENDRVVAMTGLQDRSQIAAALRVCSRGLVPDDPQVRAAAYRVAGWRLEQLQRQRAYSLTAMVLFVVFYIAMAFAQSAWWLLGAALFAGLLAYGLFAARRLEQRIDLLAAPAASHFPAGTYPG